MKLLILNPPFVFGIFLLLTMLSTFLGWSDLFEKISDETIMIYSFSASFLLAVGLFSHYKLTREAFFKSGQMLHAFNKSNNDKALFFVIILFFLLEVIYSRSIPILSGYKEVLESNFGIPLFHGLFLSFMSYVSVVFYQKYLVSKKLEYIIYIVVINILFILLARRGIIVFHILSYTFLYLYYYFTFRKVTFRFYMNLILLIIAFFYVFNLIGNIRLGQSNDNYILSIGKANTEFLNSGMPTSAFFGYLYISTPVSIFDLNLINHDKSYTEFVLANVIPDFITKRFGYEQDVEMTIVSGFNVSGVFGQPYHDKGIIGVALIILYYLVLFLVVLYMIFNHKKRALVLLSMFLALSVLLTFSNLLNYSGYILQIYFALLFKDLLSFTFGGKNIFPVRNRIEKN